jgi:hypothetical protein
MLGATKELTSEYVDLAEITEDEQKQIAHTVMNRPDRDSTIKMLVKKGVPHREIVEVTGWSLVTVKRIASKLAPQRPRKVSNDTKKVSKDTSVTSSAATRAHRARIAEEAAAEGVTEEPTEKYRIVYAWRDEGADQRIC